ncbi:uncharacterized protein TNCV_2304081 [Trichonephila clavipes]|nr:uncharacterized protein TNCV_2304081 [Trichonephila clavipes]
MRFFKITVPNVVGYLNVIENILLKGTTTVTCTTCCTTCSKVHELLEPQKEFSVPVAFPSAEDLIARILVAAERTCDIPGIFQNTLQDALFICYKQSPDNAHSVAFSQRSSSTRLIEDETFNDSDIINNLIDYKDGQEEPDSLRADKNMQGFSFPTNWKSINFVK